MSEINIEGMKKVATLSAAVLPALVELAGEFLCSNLAVERLREKVEAEIGNISQIESAHAPEELNRALESLVDFLEARYSRPFENTKDELAKMGVKGDLWELCKVQMKRYRRSLIAIVTESGEAPQRKLTNFNYEFIINSCASGEEGSKLLVRMKISSVDCSGKIHNTAFELSLPDFYELYHELKKAKNMIDMMAQFLTYFLSYIKPIQQ